MGLHGDLAAQQPLPADEICRAPVGGKEAVVEPAALAGTDIVGGCLYFYAPALSQGTWIRANRTYYTTIGCHRFYL